MTSPTALVVRGVTKKFGAFTALNNVDLNIAQGRVVGLVGQNGAGKSTLMKILNGQYPHGSYQGEIEVGGERVRLHTPRDSSRFGIGIVPQEVSVIDQLTVGENIHIGQYGSALLSSSRMIRTAQTFLDEIRLPLDARRAVGTMTVSEKQLVMIARTLFARPKVLILDEPTTALTETEVARLFDVVRARSSEGMSTVFISHKLNEIFELADEVIVLRDGQVADHLQKDEFDHERIVNQIIGGVLGDEFPPRDTPVRDDIALDVVELTVPDARSTTRNVVNEVSLSVRSGEIVGIGGALGSGRTEFLEALFGLRKVSSGSITLRGTTFTPHDPVASIAAGLAFVPEDRKRDGLYFNGSVKDNLTLSVLGRLSMFGFIKTKAHDSLARAEIARYGVKTGSPDTPIGSLSGGNQQKVLIARATATTPELLLLDEPTKGVDVGARAEIYRLVRLAASSGTAVLMVSSDLPELLGLCDRIVIFSDGRASSEIEAPTATHQELLLAAMSGQLSSEETS